MWPLPSKTTSSETGMPRPAPARVGADLVYAPVVDYREDPGAHAAPASPIACCRAPNLEEGVLSKVLCGLALAHHAVGQRVRGAAVAVVGRGESIGVAVADEGDQILVGEERVVPSVHSEAVPFSDTRKGLTDLSGTVLPPWMGSA